MPDVLFEKRPDGVALITLNRPERMNSLGGDLIPLATQYLLECEGDREVRCVALTGAGRAFCAGGDVGNMRARNESQVGGDGPSTNIIAALDASVAGLRSWQDGLSLKLHTMAKPTVALVNGYAVGAGLSIALSCDIRVCGSEARFGTAFRNIGLSGDFGGTYFLQRLVGMGRARELYFSAEVLDANRALELGIANRVVPQDQLLEAGLAYCAKLAAGPTGAYGRMKANLNLAATAPLPDVLDQEALFQRISGLSQDSREAVLAFLEKRAPQFTGE